MFDTSRIHPMMDKVQAYLGQWFEDHLKQIRPADWWQSALSLGDFCLSFKMVGMDYNMVIST